jgi:hypothetical protein
METHPDRARALGRSESALAREFRAVSDAYRVLSAIAGGPLPEPLRAAANGPPPPQAARPWTPSPRPRAAPDPAGPRPWRPAAAPRPEAPRSGVSAGPRVRVGVRPEDLPRRRLRFAEFLYYTNRIPWTELVDAISWQRRQRPPFGRIAVDFGFLRPEEVAAILEQRRVECALDVPFGEYAVRKGWLTSFQVLAVLGQQLRLQRRIGEFFVSKGLLEPADVDEVRRRMMRHNARYAA